MPTSGDPLAPLRPQSFSQKTNFFCLYFRFALLPVFLWKIFEKTGEVECQPRGTLWPRYAHNLFLKKQIFFVSIFVLLCYRYFYGKFLKKRVRWNANLGGPFGPATPTIFFPKDKFFLSLFSFCFVTGIFMENF